MYSDQNQQAQADPPETSAARPDLADNNTKTSSVLLYTDGSCDKDRMSAWAFIAVNPETKEVIFKDSGILTGEICSTWNIGAEITAVVKGVEWARSNNYKVTILHDLEGIERWATGKWRAKNKFTKEFQLFAAKNRDVILGFKWTKAHVGEKFNEMTDELAGMTLRRGY